MLLKINEVSRELDLRNPLIDEEKPKFIWLNRAKKFSKPVYFIWERSILERIVDFIRSLGR